MTAEKTITVAALTGGQNTPSSRFRVRQYIGRLKEHGIEVTEHIPYWGESCGLPSPFKMASRIPAVFRSRKADLVWLSRDLVQGYETFERCLKRPRLMDVDDAIWQSRPLGRLCQPHIARGMDAIVVGNDYLAEYYARYCRRIHILPTAIDVQTYTPGPRPAAGQFVIGWTGLACNYSYLRLVEPALKQFFSEVKEARLLVLSNRPYETNELPSDRIRYVQWSPQNEASCLHEMTVGLMPLPDNRWTRGKCSFKMLQYMASGLPVVVSPVGMNRQVLEKGDCGFSALTTSDWIEAFRSLYKDPLQAAAKGERGRMIVEQHFSADVIAAQWADIFRTYAP